MWTGLLCFVKLYNVSNPLDCYDWYVIVKVISYKLPFTFDSLLWSSQKYTFSRLYVISYGLKVNLNLN